MGPDLVAVAAPIRDHRGEVIAAASISAPSFCWPPEALEQLASPAAEAAVEISRRLEFAGAAPVEARAEVVEMATARR